ncbi:MAG: cation diffusion facilitator family transporter [Lachnospirales bacterium]
MTEYLIKKFIKNYGDTRNAETRKEYGFFTSTVGILINIFLALTKLSIGILTNSISIIIDSFNNFTDSLSSIISYVAFKISSKPADNEHPFGHGRAEYLSTFLIGFLIVILGWEFLKESIQKLFYPSPINVNIYVCIILVMTILIKLWLGYFFNYCGKEISSGVLIATSKDSYNDAIITTFTFVSLLTFQFLNINLDGICGIFLSCLLFKTAYDICNNTISSLLGEKPDKYLIHEIKSRILDFDEIYGVHDLIIHNYGPSNVLATIHVEVSDSVDINSSHELIDKIEKDISEDLDIHLTIHMDPIALNDEVIINVKYKIFEYILNNNLPIGVHDFRIVKGGKTSNIIFECEVPHNYTEIEIADVKNKLNDIVQKIDKSFKCIISFENSFID